MTATAEVRFELPAPRIPLSPEQRDAFVAALRACPGVWALMGQHSSGRGARQIAYCVRNSLRPWTNLPAGSFEADAKTVMGEHRVYVRYVGQHASSEVAPR